jgi:hypothetical protein
LGKQAGQWAQVFSDALLELGYAPELREHLGARQVPGDRVWWEIAIYDPQERWGREFVGEIRVFGHGEIVISDEGQRPGIARKVLDETRLGFEDVSPALAQEAGAEFAQDSADEVDFQYNLREQLAEGAEMEARDPKSVVPEFTTENLASSKRSRERLAREMLEDFGRDVARDLDTDTVERYFERVGLPSRAALDFSAAFLSGMRRELASKNMREWLAEMHILPVVEAILASARSASAGPRGGNPTRAGARSAPARPRGGNPTRAGTR